MFRQSPLRASPTQRRARRSGRDRLWRGIATGALLLVSLAACSSQEPAETESDTLFAPLNAQDASSPDEEAPVDPTATPPDPAAEPEQPAAYPPPQQDAAPADPYPGGIVPVLKPLGVQCEEANAPDLIAAEAELRAAGASVNLIEMVELAVAASCGSPTSEHYRAQIGADHVALVEELGWQRE